MLRMRIKILNSSRFPRGYPQTSIDKLLSTKTGRGWRAGMNYHYVEAKRGFTIAEGAGHDRRSRHGERRNNESHQIRIFMERRSGRRHRAIRETIL